jgi:hypothetical protein
VLPVLRPDLLQQPVKVRNAGFGGILLMVAAIARRPRGLILSPVKAAKRRFRRVAFLVLPVFRAVQFVVVVGMVVYRVLELPGHIVISLVEKPGKPVYLVSGFLAESRYRLERFLGSDGVG